MNKIKCSVERINSLVNLLLVMRNGHSYSFELGLASSRLLTSSVTELNSYFHLDLTDSEYEQICDMFTRLSTLLLSGKLFVTQDISSVLNVGKYMVNDGMYEVLRPHYFEEACDYIYRYGVTLEATLILNPSWTKGE